MAEVWPTLQVKPVEKKTTQSSVKRKRRLAYLPRAPHCAFDCLLLLIRPNNAFCVGYTYWRYMHHCLMLGVVVRLHLMLLKNCKVFETNKLFYIILPSLETKGKLVRTIECSRSTFTTNILSSRLTTPGSPKMLFYLKPEATSTNERITMLDFIIFSMGCFNL